MSALHRVQPEPATVLLTQEKWEQFGRQYRAEFDFCRILQNDYIAASALLYESGLAQTRGARDDPLLRLAHRWAHRLDAQHCDSPFLQDKVEERGINIYNRIYTSYRLIGEFLPRSPLAATSDALWADLHVTIEIRNRIVHPKCTQDLEVSPSDAMLVVATGDEFNQHVNQFALGR